MRRFSVRMMDGKRMVHSVWGLRRRIRRRRLRSFVTGRMSVMWSSGLKGRTNGTQCYAGRPFGRLRRGNRNTVVWVSFCWWGTITTRRAVAGSMRIVTTLRMVLMSSAWIVSSVVGRGRRWPVVGGRWPQSLWTLVSMHR